MSKDIKKALEHCIEWNCVDCPNREELGSGETVCRGRLLTDVLEYVFDIEAKLAEIQNEKDELISKYRYWKGECVELKEQLAESERKSFILYSMLYETLEKQGCENVASQIDQMTGCTYEKEADCFKGNKNYDQLKQQLSEKDQAIESLQEINQSLCQTCNNDAKEIERLREQITEEKNRNKKLNYEAQKYYEDAYCNNFQNQKAIAELEKVKDFLIKNKHIALGDFDIVKLEESKIEVCRLDIAIYEIDKQIKSLKGENK